MSRLMIVGYALWRWQRLRAAVATLATRVAGAGILGDGVIRRAVARVQQPAPELRLGQSMVEYAIVLALVAIASMVAVQLLGDGVTQVFTNILGKVQGLGR